MQPNRPFIYRFKSSYSFTDKADSVWYHMLTAIWWYSVMTEQSPPGSRFFLSRDTGLFLSQYSAAGTCSSSSSNSESCKHLLNWDSQVLKHHRAAKRKLKRTTNRHDFSQVFSLFKSHISALSFIFCTKICWTVAGHFRPQTNKQKNLWPLIFFCLPPWSLWLDSQRDLQVLVDHVADADRWDDLHEVGCQASVESYCSLSPNNVSEQSCHVHLRTSSQRSCRNKGKMMPSNNTSNTSFYFCPLHLKSVFVSINPEYVPTALLQILYSTFSGNCSKILLWIKILVTVKLSTLNKYKWRTKHCIQRGWWIQKLKDLG